MDKQEYNWLARPRSVPRVGPGLIEAKREKAQIAELSLIQHFGEEA